MNVFCNAGHFIRDRNAPHDMQTESELVMRVRNKVRLKLPHALYVPDNLDLGESIKWVNQRANKDDFAVSIHINSNPNKNIRGVEIYYHENYYVASLFAYYLSRKMNLPNRGARHMSESAIGELGWLNKLNCPSILIEVCYLSNEVDRLFITNPLGIAKTGRVIANSILKYKKAQKLSKRFRISFNWLLRYLLVGL